MDWQTPAVTQLTKSFLQQIAEAKAGTTTQLAYPAICSDKRLQGALVVEAASRALLEVVPALRPTAVPAIVNVVQGVFRSTPLWWEPYALCKYFCFTCFYHLASLLPASSSGFTKLCRAVAMLQAPDDLLNMLLSVVVAPKSACSCDLKALCNRGVAHGRGQEGAVALPNFALALLRKLAQHQRGANTPQIKGLATTCFSPICSYARADSVPDVSLVVREIIHDAYVRQGSAMKRWQTVSSVQTEALMQISEPSVVVPLTSLCTGWVATTATEACIRSYFRTLPCRDLSGVLSGPRGGSLSPQLCAFFLSMRAPESRAGMYLALLRYQDESVQRLQRLMVVRQGLGAFCSSEPCQRPPHSAAGVYQRSSMHGRLDLSAWLSCGCNHELPEDPAERAVARTAFQHRYGDYPRSVWDPATFQVPTSTTAPKDSAGGSSPSAARSTLSRGELASLEAEHFIRQTWLKSAVLLYTCALPLVPYAPPSYTDVPVLMKRMSAVTHRLFYGIGPYLMPTLLHAVLRQRSATRPMGTPARARLFLCPREHRWGLGAFTHTAVGMQALWDAVRAWSVSNRPIDFQRPAPVPSYQSAEVTTALNALHEAFLEQEKPRALEAKRDDSPQPFRQPGDVSDGDATDVSESESSALTRGVGAFTTNDGMGRRRAGGWALSSTRKRGGRRAGRQRSKPSKRGGSGDRKSRVEESGDAQSLRFTPFYSAKHYRNYQQTSVVCVVEGVYVQHARPMAQLIPTAHRKFALQSFRSTAQRASEKYVQYIRKKQSQLEEARKRERVRVEQIIKEQTRTSRRKRGRTSMFRGSQHPGSAGAGGRPHAAFPPPPPPSLPDFDIGADSYRRNYSFDGRSLVDRPRALSVSQRPEIARTVGAPRRSIQVLPAAVHQPPHPGRSGREARKHGAASRETVEALVAYSLLRKQRRLMEIGAPITSAAPVATQMQKMVLTDAVGYSVAGLGMPGDGMDKKNTPVELGVEDPEDGPRGGSGVHHPHMLHSKSVRDLLAASKDNNRLDGVPLPREEVRPEAFMGPVASLRNVMQELSRTRTSRFSGFLVFTKQHLVWVGALPARRKVASLGDVQLEEKKEAPTAQQHSRGGSDSHNAFVYPRPRGAGGMHRGQSRSAGSGDGVFAFAPVSESPSRDLLSAPLRLSDLSPVQLHWWRCVRFPACVAQLLTTPQVPVVFPRDPRFSMSLACCAAYCMGHCPVHGSLYTLSDAGVPLIDPLCRRVAGSTFVPISVQPDDQCSMPPSELMRSLPWYLAVLAGASLRSFHVAGAQSELEGGGTVGNVADGSRIPGASPRSASAQQRRRIRRLHSHMSSATDPLGNHTADPAAAGEPYAWRLVHPVRVVKELFVASYVWQGSQEPVAVVGGGGRAGGARSRGSEADESDRHSHHRTNLLRPSVRHALPGRVSPEPGSDRSESDGRMGRVRSRWEEEDRREMELERKRVQLYCRTKTQAVFYVTHLLSGQRGGAFQSVDSRTLPVSVDGVTDGPDTSHSLRMPYDLGPMGEVVNSAARPSGWDWLGASSSQRASLSVTERTAVSDVVADSLHPECYRLSDVDCSRGARAGGRSYSAATPRDASGVPSLRAPDHGPAREMARLGCSWLLYGLGAGTVRAGPQEGAAGQGTRRKLAAMTYRQAVSFVGVAELCPGDGRQDYFQHKDDRKTGPAARPVVHCTGLPAFGGLFWPVRSLEFGCPLAWDMLFAGNRAQPSGASWDQAARDVASQLEADGVGGEAEPQGADGTPPTHAPWQEGMASQTLAGYGLSPTAPPLLSWSLFLNLCAGLLFYLGEAPDGSTLQVRRALPRLPSLPLPALHFNGPRGCTACGQGYRTTAGEAAESDARSTGRASSRTPTHPRQNLRRTPSPAKPAPAELACDCQARLGSRLAGAVKLCMMTANSFESMGVSERPAGRTGADASDRGGSLGKSGHDGGGRGWQSLQSPVQSGGRDVDELSSCSSTASSLSQEETMVKVYGAAVSRTALRHPSCRLAFDRLQVMAEYELLLGDQWRAAAYNSRASTPAGGGIPASAVGGTGSLDGEEVRLHRRPSLSRDSTVSGSQREPSETSSQDDFGHHRLPGSAAISPSAAEHTRFASDAISMSSSALAEGALPPGGLRDTGFSVFPVGDQRFGRYLYQPFCARCQDVVWEAVSSHSKALMLDLGGEHNHAPYWDNLPAASLEQADGTVVGHPAVAFPRMASPLPSFLTACVYSYLPAGLLSAAAFEARMMRIVGENGLFCYDTSETEEGKSRRRSPSQIPSPSLHTEALYVEDYADAVNRVLHHFNRSPLRAHLGPPQPAAAVFPAQPHDPSCPPLLFDLLFHTAVLTGQSASGSNGRRHRHGRFSSMRGSLELRNLMLQQYGSGGARGDQGDLADAQGTGGRRDSEDDPRLVASPALDQKSMYTMRQGFGSPSGPFSSVTGGLGSPDYPQGRPGSVSSTTGEDSLPAAAQQPPDHRSTLPSAVSGGTDTPSDSGVREDGSAGGGDGVQHRLGSGTLPSRSQSSGDTEAFHAIPQSPAILQASVALPAADSPQSSAGSLLPSREARPDTADQVVPEVPAAVNPEPLAAPSSTDHTSFSSSSAAGTGAEGAVNADASATQDAAGAGTGVIDASEQSVQGSPPAVPAPTGAAPVVPPSSSRHVRASASLDEQFDALLLGTGSSVGGLSGQPRGSSAGLGDITTETGPGALRRSQLRLSQAGSGDYAHLTRGADPSTDQPASLLEAGKLVSAMQAMASANPAELTAPSAHPLPVSTTSGNATTGGGAQAGRMVPSPKRAGQAGFRMAVRRSSSGEQKAQVDAPEHTDQQQQQQRSSRAASKQQQNADSGVLGSSGLDQLPRRLHFQPRNSSSDVSDVPSSVNDDRHQSPVPLPGREQHMRTPHYDYHRNSQLHHGARSDGAVAPVAVTPPSPSGVPDPPMSLEAQMESFLASSVFDFSEAPSGSPPSPGGVSEAMSGFTVPLDSTVGSIGARMAPRGSDQGPRPLGTAPRSEGKQSRWSSSANFRANNTGMRSLQASPGSRSVSDLPHLASPSSPTSPTSPTHRAMTHLTRQAEQSYFGSADTQVERGSLTRGTSSSSQLQVRGDEPSRTRPLPGFQAQQHARTPTSARQTAQGDALPASRSSFAPRSLFPPPPPPDPPRAYPPNSPPVGSKSPPMLRSRRSSRMLLTRELTSRRLISPEPVGSAGPGDDSKERRAAASFAASPAARAAFQQSGGNGGAGDQFWGQFWAERQAPAAYEDVRVLQPGPLVIPLAGIVRFTSGRLSAHFFFQMGGERKRPRFSTAGSGDGTKSLYVRRRKRAASEDGIGPRRKSWGSGLGTAVSAGKSKKKNTRRRGASTTHRRAVSEGGARHHQGPRGYRKRFRTVHPMPPPTEDERAGEVAIDMPDLTESSMSDSSDDEKMGGPMMPDQVAEELAMGRDLFYIEVHYAREVYSFYPFYSEGLAQIVSMLHDLTGLDPFDAAGYKSQFLQNLQRDLRERVLATLSEEKAPWLRHTKPLTRVIQDLTAASGGQRLVDIERLYHSCRLNHEVLQFTVDLLIEIFGDDNEEDGQSSEFQKQKVLAVMSRLLDPVVMNPNDTVFAVLVAWMAKTYPKLDPYRHRDAVRLVGEMRIVADEMMTQPVGAIGVSQLPDSFDRLHEQLEYQRKWIEGE